VFASCKKDQPDDVPPPPPVVVTSYEAIVTGSLDALTTRTSLDDLDLTWSADDNIGVYYFPAGAEDAEIINRQFKAASATAGQKSGQFDAANKIGFVKEATAHQLYAVYPYDQTGGANPAAISVSIPAIQPQNAEGTFEWNGGFFVAETSVTLPKEEDNTTRAVEQEPEVIDEVKSQAVAFDFKYPFSIIELVIDGVGSEIEGETLSEFTLASSYPIVGDMSYDLVSGLFTGVEGKDISVNLPEAKPLSEPVTAWLVINPSEMDADGEFTIDFDTADYAVSLSLEVGEILAGQKVLIEANVAELVSAGKAEVEYTGELPAESNSYIVSPGGFAEISVSRAYAAWRQAADNTELTGAITADIVWQTPQSLIGDVTLLRGDKGERTVIKVQTAAELQGNALIGVYFDGVLKYAWHVWVTGAEFTTQPLNGFEIMDRNLGALSGTEGQLGTIGFYYQWGRPYPLVTMEPTDSTYPSYVIATMYDSSNTAVAFSTETTNTSASFSLENPLKFINNDSWTGVMGATSWINEDLTKGLFDPCPIGWKAPYLNAAGESPWKNVSTSATGENKGLRISSGRFRGWRIGTDPIWWYPASGTVSSNPSSAPSLAGMYGYYWLAQQSASTNAGISMEFMSSMESNTSGTKKEAYPIRCVKDNEE
jgi:hypothetical protein